MNKYRNRILNSMDCPKEKLSQDENHQNITVTRVDHSSHPASKKMGMYSLFMNKIR